MTTRLAAFTLWLPPIFWLTYSLWNALWPAPPYFGPVSGISVQYLLMAPGVALLLRRGAGPHFSGQWAYLGWLAWVALGLAWSEAATGVEPVKSLVVYGLLGLVAAQVIGGGARAVQVFAGGVLLTATIYSLWTLWFALETRFAYRAGVPINPNFIATLVAPGLVVGLALLIVDGGWRRWLWLGPLVMLHAYACLLLGSRGVLVGLVAAVAVIAIRMRPVWASSRRLIAAAAVVVLVAQFPVVPDTLYMSARAGWHRATTAGEANPAAERKPEVGRYGYPVGSGGFPPRGWSGAPPPPRLESQSTALARFGEAEMGSFNLRGALWARAWRYVTSGVRPFVVGGGLGTSRQVAHDANPVFWNMHNVVVQVMVDFGLIGLVLFGLMHWSIVRRVAMHRTWSGHAMVAGIAFFLVTGLTATVIDLHLYWVFLGIAAAAPPAST
jgi:O-antigen ligase